MLKADGIQPWHKRYDDRHPKSMEGMKEAAGKEVVKNNKGKENGKLWDNNGKKGESGAAGFSRFSAADKAASYFSSPYFDSCSLMACRIR